LLGPRIGLTCRATGDFEPALIAVSNRAAAMELSRPEVG
jgi:hypothetical protein